MFLCTYVIWRIGKSVLFLPAFVSVCSLNPLSVKPLKSLDNRLQPFQAMKPFETTLLALLVCLTPTSLVADQLMADPPWYNYYPTTIFALGAGFSPNGPTASKQQAVNFIVQSDNIALTTKFNVYLVMNSESLNSALGIDTNIDAHYLVFGGSSSFSVSNTFHENTNNLNRLFTIFKRCQAVP